MIKIKDFKVGQEVIVFDEYLWKYGWRHTRVTKVAKVGRKYVTTQGGTKYEVTPKSEIGLIGSERGVYRLYLFITQADADMHINKLDLERWLSKVNAYRGEYTLEQLKAVKAILEPEEEQE